MPYKGQKTKLCTSDLCCLVYLITTSQEEKRRANWLAHFLIVFSSSEVFH